MFKNLDGKKSVIGIVAWVVLKIATAQGWLALDPATLVTIEAVIYGWTGWGVLDKYARATKTK